ncbi:MAG: DUF1284 domain-containing protein [Nitrospirae bacterium]|nr:DUF1284 domain-containing protein [Candidatus Manganitrophaceae bacterium]
MPVGNVAVPIIIRGHTLLCLQGFRGEGYNAAFIEVMAGAHRELAAFPETPVQVVARADLFCRACPNLASDGCRLKGEGFEGAMQRQDRAVMARLRIAEGEVLPWREILLRISRQVSGEDLDAICGACPWLPLGYCREGINALNVVPHN